MMCAHDDAPPAALRGGVANSARGLRNAVFFSADGVCSLSHCLLRLRRPAFSGGADWRPKRRRTRRRTNPAIFMTRYRMIMTG